MRADGWNRIPLIRMTNINLRRATGMSLDDIIADTDDGLLLESNRSWSIDDRRLNFQFGCEIAREIKGGKVGTLYRNATYTGITPEFWRSCDAVADARVVDARRHHELRQGPARPGHARRAWLQRRPLPRRPGRRGRNGERHRGTGRGRRGVANAVSRSPSARSRWRSSVGRRRPRRSSCAPTAP